MQLRNNPARLQRRIFGDGRHGAERRRIEIDARLFGSVHLHEDEPRRVPDLVRESTVALRPGHIESYIRAGRGHRGQGEAHGIRPVLLHNLNRVDDVALGLRHLLAVGVADERVNVHLFEGHRIRKRARAAIRHGHVGGEPAAEHNHARHPEEENVKAGDEQARRVERVKICAAQGCIRTRLRRDVRPAEDRDRQQAGREPRVEHVGFLRNPVGPAMCAGRGIHARHRDLAARGAMPRRNAMAPPELPRDAPVMDVVHPLEVGLRVHLRREPDVAFLHRGDGLVSQRLNLDEPLHREPRLHHRLAAVAVAHVVGVLLHAGQQALCFEVVDNLLARDVAIETRVGAAFGVDVRRLVHHVDGGQVVPLPEREVVGVMRGRHLHRAGTEVPAHPLVQDDGNRAVHER